MRVPLDRIPFAALAAGILCSACVQRTWRDLALQERPSKETPELAFETFRAAIRLDDPALAYGVLSEAMKQRDAIDLTWWSIGWDRFFKRYPAARLLANAAIEHTESLDAREAWIEAAAYGRRIRLDFIRQDYYTVRGRSDDGAVVVADGFLSDLATRVRRTGSSDGSIVVGIVADPRLEAVELSTVDLFLLASEWKILGISEVSDRESKPLTPDLR